jgi:hypothetical protein
VNNYSCLEKLGVRVHSSITIHGCDEAPGRSAVHDVCTSYELAMAHYSLIELCVVNLKCIHQIC